MTTADLADYAARQIAQKGAMTCGHDGARKFMNYSACPDCTPAKRAGHPEPPTPTCCRPLVCYLPCCLQKLEPTKPEPPSANEQVEKWKAYARAEILTLAGLGYPFGPADLAALLPLKLAGDRAREWVMWLIEEGIEAGAIVATGDNRWKGARS